MDTTCGILTELSGAVEREAWHRVISASSTDVEDVLVLVGRAILSEELDSLGTTSVIAGPCDADKLYLQRNLDWSPE
jgi:hypothetical protein